MQFFLMACLMDGPVLSEYFPTKVEGGEENDEAMAKKKTRKEGEQGKHNVGEKRKWTWKCNCKKSRKVGKESSIYKCIQTIPPWGHAAP